MSEPTVDAKAFATTPPEPVRAACRQGLALWSEHSKSLAKSAKRRAENLAAGHPITPNMLGRLRTFFAKHDSESSKTPQQAAEVMLAGGEPGRAWVEKLCRASAATAPSTEPAAEQKPPEPSSPRPQPEAVTRKSNGQPRKKKRARPPIEAQSKQGPTIAKRLKSPARVAPGAEPAVAERAKRAKRADSSRFAAAVYGQEPSSAERIAKTTRDMLKRFIEGG